MALNPNPERARMYLAGHAAMAELESTLSAITAATLRKDAAEADALRAKAHELLDQHIDLKISGVTAIVIDIERETRGR